MRRDTIRTKRVLLLCAAILAALACNSWGKTIYVDDDANGLGDGSSWQNALACLQDALDLAQRFPEPVEIRVAQGVYKPDQGKGLTPRDTHESFWLFNVSVLKGGYAGAGRPDPNARDVNGYPTVLSGDLNGNDPTPLPAVSWGRSSPDGSDNAESVIRVTGENVTVDGFIITGGYFRAIYRGNGDGSAGMCVFGNNIKIAHCTFTDNRTVTARGGAIYIANGRDAEIVNCTFTNNYSGTGGALFNFLGSVDLYGCVFTQNRSESGGGAIATLRGRVFSASCEFVRNSSNGSSAGNGGAASAEWEGTLEFEDSLFIGNTAAVSGGAVFGDVHHSTLTFRNSLLVANVAKMGGGAIAAPVVSLINCTIAGNRAAENPEISVGVGGSSELSGCIVWGNEKAPQKDRTASDWLGTCSYCCLDPNVRASRVIGNIDQEPAFAAPGYWDPNATPEDPNDDFWVAGDYHLKSQAGRRDPDSKGWVKDDVTSPCIDAGDPNSPVGEEPLPNGGRINMGAYGGTAEASKSVTSQNLAMPRVVYVFSSNAEAAADFESLLEGYGCSVSVVALKDLTALALADCDVVIVGNDTGFGAGWGNAQSVAGVKEPGKPVIGLGEGGYALFGKLGLAIGYPYGGHANDKSIYVVDPNAALFARPNAITIGQDRILQLYSETADVSIYLLPVPETVVPFGRSATGSHDNYPLVLEAQRYLLWGFVEPPEKMTQTGKDLFLNAVVLAGNNAWGR